MFSNNLYNLMLQATEEHKSLWRIKDEYLKDAEGADDCKAFWQALAMDKEKHIQDLEALIKKHMV